MKQKTMTVQSVRRLNHTMTEMKLSGLGDAVIHPGTFVNIQIPGYFLRRPISVCAAEGDILTLVFRIVGKGTEYLSAMHAGETLDVLTELGNGYDMKKAGDRPLLIGGGAGIPPMYALAERLLKEEKRVTVILGFNGKDEMFYTEEFERLGAKVIVTTADGSAGIRGFVTDALPSDCTYFYACGPAPMEKALYRLLDIPGEFSLEERMGCGFGACMGCSMETRNGPRRICRDGPVFAKEELLWED